MTRRELKGFGASIIAILIIGVLFDGLPTLRELVFQAIGWLLVLIAFILVRRWLKRRRERAAGLRH